MRKLLVIAALGLSMTACGAVQNVGAAMTGDLIEYRYSDNVRCWKADSGGVACLQVKP